MSDAARARKLAGRIQQIVAATISGRLKDPSLSMVTVTDVRLTADLRDASVYYTVFDPTTLHLSDEAAEAEQREAQSQVAEALERAAGLLRTEVGRGTGVRFTPTLTFVLDAVPETARHIDDLLARARTQDEQVRAQASHARPAGEADPYRKPAQSEPEAF